MSDFKTRFQPIPRSVITADPQVLSARFSPCGQLLVAGDYIGKVRRWCVTEDLIELPPVDGHSAWVQGLAFQPDGTLAFTADSWGQIRAWRCADLHPMPVWIQAAAHDGWIRELAVSPDGQTLASCGLDRVIRLWSAEDGSKIAELTGNSHDIYCLRFHPENGSLVSADARGIIKEWDLNEARCVRELDASLLYSLSRLQDVGGVKMLAFNRSGDMLACGGTTPKNGGTVTGVPTILLFEFGSGKVLQTWKHGTETDCYVHDLAFHDAGFLMAVTCGTPGQGKLLCYALDETEPFLVLTKMANTQSLSLHPDGERFAVVATNPGSNGNGRQLKDGQYRGNQSPIHLWSFAKV